MSAGEAPRERRGRGALGKAPPIPKDMAPIPRPGAPPPPPLATCGCPPAPFRDVGVNFYLTASAEKL